MRFHRNPVCSVSVNQPSIVHLSWNERNTTIEVLGVLCFGWVLSGLLLGCSESAVSYGFQSSPPHPSSPINGKVEGEWGSSEYIRASIRPTFSRARFSAIPLSSTPIELAPIQGGVFLCLFRARICSLSRYPISSAYSCQLTVQRNN